MGYASDSHAEALNLLALQLHQVAEASRILGTMGDLGYQTIDSARIRNALNLAAKHAQSLMVEFGLTPASSTRVALPEHSKGNRKGNRFTGFGAA